MTNHNVWYPMDYLDMPVRENLRLSQTNMTSDAIEGLRHAAAAYDQGLNPNIAQDDPTAAGEAAAKAGFRSEQLDLGKQVTSDWFMRSHDALSEDDAKTQRERVATFLLEGRANALRLGKLAARGTAVSEDDRWDTRSTFANGSLHLQVRDPYATMLYGHWATFEAMDGSSIHGTRLALYGIRSAIIAREENANTPNQTLTIREKIQKNGHFILKHTARNLLAIGLAITRPLENIPRLQHKRRSVSLKSLG